MQDERIPAWITRGLVLALLGLGASGLGLWISSVNTSVNAATIVNAVQDKSIAEQTQDTKEIKETLLRLEDKLDDALKERRVVTVYRDQPRQSKPIPKVDEYTNRVGGLSGPDPEVK